MTLRSQNHVVQYDYYSVYLLISGYENNFSKKASFLGIKEVKEFLFPYMKNKYMYILVEEQVVYLRGHFLFIKFHLSTLINSCFRIPLEILAWGAMFLKTSGELTHLHSERPKQA